MAEELLRSKHAFGSSANLDKAIADGAVDSYDILFLDGNTDNPRIGWIDKTGNKVILPDKHEVVTLNELPSSGEADKIYIVGSVLYGWDGEKFTAFSGESGITETVVDEKITTATLDVKSYTDAQIANAISIVEF